MSSSKFIGALYANAMIISLGIVSTVIILALISAVGFVSDGKINLMGFYYAFIPISAIIAGLLSGLGYCLGAHLSKVNPKIWMMSLIFVWQMIAFLGLQVSEYYYIDPVYLDTNESVPMMEYFDYIITSQSFSKTGDDPFVLGKWGYALFIVEIIAFGAGAIIPMKLLSTPDYCEECKKPYVSKRLCKVPMSPEGEAPEDSRQPEYLAYQESCDNMAFKLQSFLDLIDESLFENNPQAIVQGCEEIKQMYPNAHKSKNYMLLNLKYCEECHAGTLHYAFYTYQDKQKVVTKEIRKPISKEEVKSLIPTTGSESHFEAD